MRAFKVFSLWLTTTLTVVVPPQFVSAQEAAGMLGMEAGLGVPPRSGVVQFPPDGLGGAVAPGRDWVGFNRLASFDQAGRPQNEATIVVNPANPYHLVGGCNDYRNGETSCGWFVSFDGGRSWRSGLVGGLDEFQAAGDPSVVMNRNGRAWFCGIHFNRRDSYGGVFICRSDDGGLNWRRISYVVVHRDDNNPPFEDKPFLAIDNTGGDADGNLYVAWTRYGTGQIFFSRSLNGGENWSEPLRLYAGRGQGALPVVGPNGELFIFWKDYTEDRMLMRSSFDGGESFGDITVVAQTVILPQQLPPTRFRVNSIPAATIIPSGDFQGRLVVAWADYRNENADIYYTVSDDSGAGWSDPVRLNDDEDDRDQFFPWLTVDPTTSEVCAIWYDRRNDQNNTFIELYGARWSGDGEPPANELISTDPFDPRIDFNGNFIGDYNGVAAAMGRAYPAWCDSRRGGQDIFVADWRGARHFTPHPAPGDERHLLSISEATLAGEAPAEEDEFAVTDSAGIRVYASGSFAGDPPWEIEAELPGGFRPAAMMWRVFDRSEGVELSAGFVVDEGAPLLQAGGESLIRLSAPPPDTLRIPVGEGWNLIGIPIQPVFASPWSVFGGLGDNLNLARNRFGEFLTIRFNFSNMRPMVPVEGYQVGVFRADTLTVLGMRLEADHPLLLSPGWNIIPFLPSEPMDPWRAFDAILNRIDIVKDDRGRFMVPAFRFSNLGSLQPLKGYQLKLNGEEPVQFRFPVEEARHGRTLRSVRAGH